MSSALLILGIVLLAIAVAGLLGMGAYGLVLYLKHKDCKDSEMDCKKQQKLGVALLSAGFGGAAVAGVFLAVMIYKYATRASIVIGGGGGELAAARAFQSKSIELCQRADLNEAEVALCNAARISTGPALDQVSNVLRSLSPEE